MMSKPVPLSAFTRQPPQYAVDRVAGLTGAIDSVAAAATASHRFLRYGWFAAALGCYGGSARTWIVSREGVPVLALPIVQLRPGWAGGAAVLGCYWPFRSFPVSEDAGIGAFEALLQRLASDLRVLRFGPVYDNDPALIGLSSAAKALGWAVIPRFVAESYRLDMAAARAEANWPRSSTLKKNRFHEKHLAAHGELDWSFTTGAAWDAQLFDALAAIEHRSWIATDTDGGDAKFTAEGHGRFWRLAAADPVIAEMMWAAILRIDGVPMAFSFDLNAGTLKYAIANSYDPAVAKHSPGKLLYYRNLVRAIEDGMTVVDWGAGDSGYKRTIGAVTGPAIRDWLFVRPGISAKVARLLAGIWRASGNRPQHVEAEPAPSSEPSDQD